MRRAAALASCLLTVMGLAGVLALAASAPMERSRGYRSLCAYDARLGWQLAPGVHESPDLPAVTITREGFRGEVWSTDTIVVGDSVAFGWGVEDHEAWPALVDAANAGVPSYGLDQAILRAEQLAALHRPRRVLVGVIPDDLVRARCVSHSWRSKPWFTGAGELRGVPVPTSPVTRRLVASGEGTAVVDAITARMAALPGAALVLYRAPWEDQARFVPLRRAARERRIPVLDLTGALSGRDYLPDGHPSAAGHRAIAAHVMTWLQELGS